MNSVLCTTQDSSAADLLAQKFATVFFAYGFTLPDQLFVGMTLSDDPNPQIYAVNREDPSDMFDFLQRVIVTCEDDTISITALGFMDTIEDSAMCYCQDNFLNVRDCLVMPVDNEGEADCQIVDVRGDIKKFPAHVLQFKEMHKAIFENLQEANVIQVAR